MQDKEPFLSRWSRRKLEAKQDTPAGAAQTGASVTVPAAAPAVPAAEPPAQELPQRETPEYRKLFDPQVDETLRRTALKEIFNDPHFNVMDGLDTYIDDYSISDPIPEAMLRQLNQAKNLFLFDEEKKPDGEAGDGASVAAKPAPAALANMSAPANPAPAAGADITQGIGATPPLDDSTND